MTWGAVELEPEVRDWFEGLSATQFATAVFYVDLLAEQGPLLSEPYTRQLEGKLRELRFHLGVRPVRVTYWNRLRATHRAAHGVRQDPDATDLRDCRARWALQRCISARHTADDDGEE